MPHAATRALPVSTYSRVLFRARRERGATLPRREGGREGGREGRREGRVGEKHMHSCILFRASGERERMCPSKKGGNDEESEEGRKRSLVYVPDTMMKIMQ